MKLVYGHFDAHMVPSVSGCTPDSWRPQLSVNCIGANHHWSVRISALLNWLANVVSCGTNLILQTAYVSGFLGGNSIIIIFIIDHISNLQNALSSSPCTKVLYMCAHFLFRCGGPITAFLLLVKKRIGEDPPELSCSPCA